MLLSWVRPEALRSTDRVTATSGALPKGRQAPAREPLGAMGPEPGLLQSGTEVRVVCGRRTGIAGPRMVDEVVPSVLGYPSSFDAA